MDPSKVKIPLLKNLNTDNITENVNLINSNNPDARMKYVLERLTTHLHDFARETRLSTKEWMAGINFLTKTGQICSDVRQVCAPVLPRKPLCHADIMPRRNSSSFPMSLVSPFSLTASTTPSLLDQRMAQSLVHFILTKPKTSPTARRFLMTKLGSHCLSFAR